MEQSLYGFSGQSIVMYMYKREVVAPALRYDYLKMDQEEAVDTPYE